jgi:hypothetical protein
LLRAWATNANSKNTASLKASKTFIVSLSARDKEMYTNQSLKGEVF